jgi:hypothetical protein
VALTRGSSLTRTALVGQVTIGEVQHVSSMLGIQASGGTTLFVAALIDAPGKASLSARTEPVPAADTATWNARLEFRVDAAMLEACALLGTVFDCVSTLNPECLPGLFSPVRQQLQTALAE